MERLRSGVDAEQRRLVALSLRRWMRCGLAGSAGLVASARRDRACRAWSEREGSRGLERGSKPALAYATRRLCIAAWAGRRRSRRRLARDRRAMLGRPVPAEVERAV